MNWVQLVSTVFVSLFGTSGIAYLIVKSLIDTAEKRIEQSYQKKLNAELEKFKSQLEKDVYRSNLRFEKELTIYGELSSKSIDMVFKLGSYLNKASDNSTEEEVLDEYWTKVVSAYDEANITTKKYALFVPKEIYGRYKQMNSLCREILDLERFATVDLCMHSSTEDVRKKREELIVMQDETMDYVRNYLNKSEGKGDGQAQNAQC